MNRYILLILLAVILGSTCVEAQERGVQDYSARIKEAYNAASYKEVVSMCGAAIDMNDKSSEANPLTIARFLDYKAMAHKKLGEYRDAEQCYKREVAFLQDFTSRADDVRCKLAVLYIEMGQFDRADCMLDSVTAKSRIGWSLLHRASVQMRRGNYETAEQLLKNVIQDNKGQKDLLASAHQNLGYLLMQSQGGAAFETVNEHLSSALECLPQESVEYYAVLANLAINEAKSRRYDMALTHIDKVVQWFEQRKNSTLVDYIIAVRKKAEILLMAGKRAEAQKVYREFFSLERKYATSNFSTMTEQNRLDFWKTLKPNISKVFALEDDCPEFLLDVALFRREVALLGNADGGEMTKRLNRTGQQLRKALRAHEVAIDFVRYQKNDTARYGAILVPSLSMKGGIKFIPLWTEDELRGAKISKGAMVSMSLEDALCSNNMSDKDYLYTDSLLGRFVWDRLDSELEKYDYEDVYFAPEGLLHLLAIEYLREDNGVCMHRMTTLAHLLDRGKHGIVRKSRMLAAGGFDYNSTAQQLNNPTTQQLNNSSKHDAMEFLQSKTGGTEHPFAFLKGAKIEIDSIKGSSCFATDTATTQTEEQFKRAIQDRKYDVVHLSTHGYALDVQVPVVPEALCDSITEDRSLLASGVALTGANVAYRNSAAEDGIVSAREFCDMDMGDVDLIVLSACQTGLGRFSDEGPAGLVRGLKKAGSGALIVSLWSVDDEATMLFMKHLYKAIAEANGSGGTIDIHEAFNAARINFSKEAKVVQRFDRKKMKKVSYEESYNLPRFCNSFILIDAIQ